MSGKRSLLRELGDVCLVLVVAAGLATSAAAAPGDIYVVDQDAFGGSGGVIKVDPTTGGQTTISSGGAFVDPRGIAVDADCQIIVADPNAFGGQGGLIRVDPITGIQFTVSSAGFFSDPLAVAIDDNRDLLVADAGSNSLIRVDPTTGVQTVVSVGGMFISPHGVAVNALGEVFVSDHRNASQTDQDSKVVEVNGANGAQSLVSAAGDLKRAVHLAVEPAGTLIVASLTSGLVRVDPVGGSQSLVATLSLPAGVAVDPSANLIAVSNDPAVGVVRVDPVTGTPTTISTGDLFVVPQGVAVCPVCGNGILETGEDCDDGADNGTGNSCCAADCQFKPNGNASCDGNACTRPDTCTNGVCTPGSCADGGACTWCGGTCVDTGSSCECQ